jgi:hypothetical protein
MGIKLSDNFEEYYNCGDTQCCAINPVCDFEGCDELVTTIEHPTDHRIVHVSMWCNAHADRRLKRLRGGG